MWRQLHIAVLLLGVVQLAICQTNRYYSISGSKVFRANSPYHVSVTSHGAADAAEIEVGIEGKSGSGEVYSNLKRITVQPYSSEVVRLDIEKVSPGDFNLTARGISGFKFENATSISLNEKSFTVLIQTDKAIYKPGDKVNFRVIILDANLKPFPLTGNLKIYITDAKKNRIKQWLEGQRDVSKGVFTGELELSSTTVLGDWQISVEVLDSTHNKNFEVAEYVLPKFEVTIDTPKLATFKDENVRIVVRSKYTYGKPVKGEATVSVYPKFYGSYQPFVSQLITRKVVKLDGKAPVEFHIKDELQFKDDYQREIMIEAIVEEELTGRRQNTTATMTLYKTKYNVEFIQITPKYKPGLPVETQVKVAYHDGTPVNDKVNPVEIYESYQEHYDYSVTTEEPTTVRKEFLDENGLIRLTLAIPNNTNVMNVRAKYLDTEGYMGYLPRAESKSLSYLTLNINTANPQINQEVSATVTSNKPMKYLTYIVAGRGDIIISKTIELPSVSTHKFKFLASFAMVPKAKLVVYYINADGEVVSDKATIEFRSEFQNFLKIDMSKNKAKPGEDLELTISTKPNSLVALLGVDQSVNLLKSGNDLSRNEIFDELEQYDFASGNGNVGGPWGGPVWRGYGYFYNPTWKDFDDSNLVLLTNAEEEERPRFLPSSFIQNRFQDDDVLVDRVGDVWALFHLHDDNGNPIPKLPKIRKKFPETWLWEDFSFDGTKTIQKKVPDTITSWIITGFSIDPITGFGMTQMPRKLEVFQPFFVSLNLPYSVKRGEVVAIPIVVFNYMDRDLDADVMMDNNGQEFEFTEISNEVNENKKVELFRRKTVSVKANSGSSLSFMIRPKKIGPIIIKVTATSQSAGDGVERPLLVEPEGVTQFMNKAIFVDLKDKKNFETTLDIEIPKNAVPDSTKVEVAVVGDILGSTIKNLDSLIRMPYGCGEQNMLNFVPNIVVLDYLKKINALTPLIEGKALKFMESGYQRELTYKHKDGSFSAFGESDKSGSTWLTAFVARSFRQAAKFISVEEDVIVKALDWLSQIQAPNGSFPEVGTVSHKDMQGGAGDGIALTAYTLITFLENKNDVSGHKNSISKALEYIVRNLEDLDDVYALSLAAYALQLANHNNKDYALQKLEAKATSDASTKWWHKPIPEADKKNPHYGQPNSVNVEMTGYALMTYLEAGGNDPYPILKWLIGQRNENGGFQSTQDTVIGITALAKMGAQMTSVGPKNLNIKAQYGDGVEKTMNVNDDNAMVYQSNELPSSVRSVNISATGNGFAVVQLAYRYNLNVTGAWPKFNLDPQVNKNSNPDFLHLSICTSYIPDGPATNESNMAVMEVDFPSGFTADMDTLPSLESSDKIKRVETKNGDTTVVIYFDNLDRRERCPTLTAFRTFKVAEQKPAAVVVYDYYNNARRARMFYEAPVATLCDICEGEDCGDKCQIKAEEQKSSTNPDDDPFQAKSSANTLVPLGSVLIVAANLRRLLF